MQQLQQELYDDRVVDKSMFVHQTSENKSVLAEPVFLGLNHDSHGSSASYAADAFALDQAKNLNTAKENTSKTQAAPKTSAKTAAESVPNTAKASPSAKAKPSASASASAKAHANTTAKAKASASAKAHASTATKAKPLAADAAAKIACNKDGKSACSAAKQSAADATSASAATMDSLVHASDAFRVDSTCHLNDASYVADAMDMVDAIKSTDMLLASDSVDACKAVDTVESVDSSDMVDSAAGVADLEHCNGGHEHGAHAYVHCDTAFEQRTCAVEQCAGAVEQGASAVEQGAVVCQGPMALVSGDEVSKPAVGSLLSKICFFDKEYGLGSAQKYDAIDALTIKVPESERMCPQGFKLTYKSFTKAMGAYNRIARATVAKHKLPMSIRALHLLETADQSMFAQHQEALLTLVLALGGPVLELMADPSVCAIALGSDTRVLFEDKQDEIVVLPHIEQSSIHILARELVFLNKPERIHDQDISDLKGRVGLGNFYFVADVPPHSSIPVVSMWRSTNEVSANSPLIFAAQDDPGVYGICDCRYDIKAAALRNMTPKERRTLEFCGKQEDKLEGDCEIASVLDLDLKLSARAWKMLNKIDRKWRTGNYNIESLRMLTYLVGTEIIELLANPEVTEIALNSDRRLFINTYTERSIELNNSSNTNIEALMRLLSSMLDMDLSSDKHILSGILPLDGSRVECNRPPVVPNPTLVIRKHAACSLTLDRLMDLKMLTMTEYIILEHALKARLSIIVSGETGSGKTTLLSALINQLADIAPSERVICLEDTPELMPVIANCTHAYTSDSTDMSELVRSALRQHPDRIVVGEVRGPEALDLIDALCTGHKGSFSSMHAGTPEEAMKRLGLMISRNNQAPDNYNDLVASAVDIIVQMESRPNPHIRSIKCVSGIEDDQFIILPLRSTRDIDHYIAYSQADEDNSDKTAANLTS